MSIKYLGEQFDVHCGAVDHVNVHHTNEIAQSEAATGRPFFNYWMHGAFLNILGGKKMAKSEENFLTLENAFLKRGIPPLAYRFASFQTHYRKPMEYSDASIQAAKNGLEHLCNQVREIAKAGEPTPGEISRGFREKFLEAVNDDLNMPRAMAVIQEMLKSGLAAGDKHAAVIDFDRVLGLSLVEAVMPQELPAVVQALVEARRRARESKNWAESDRLRDEIQALGYTVKDGRGGMEILKC